MAHSTWGRFLKDLVSRGKWALGLGAQKAAEGAIGLPKTQTGMGSCSRQNLDVQNLERQKNHAAASCNTI
jgi:hypothetical protein